MKTIFCYIVFVLLASVSVLRAQNSPNQYKYQINDSTVFDLPEVMIKGERPIVKMEKGRLTYNVPQLLKDKPATNVYETLKELPGILEQNDILSLIGTNSVSILINGQLSSMSYTQLVNTLKSMPASRVAKVEVMYSAPPQYNVRGALINVVLKDNSSTANSFQGEASAGYEQRFYSNANGKVDLLYTTPRITMEAMYANTWRQSHVGEDMSANSPYQNYHYNVTQNNRGKSHRDINDIRTDFAYNFSNKDKLDVTYTGSIDNGVNKRTSDTYFNQASLVQTGNKVDGTSNLHNVRLEFDGHHGLKTGIDYTHYNDNPSQALRNDSVGSLTNLQSSSSQKINKGIFFANQSFDLQKGWGINFGATLTLSKNNSYSLTYINNRIDNTATFTSVQKELTTNVFAGFTKTFSDKLSLQASLAMEYYKTTETEEGITTTLWNKSSLFPTFDLTYAINDNHMLEFSLSSDKQYPPYWSLNPTVYHLNGYSEIEGNPFLKPSREYDGTINYVFKKKYVLVAYINYLPDFIEQQSYQPADRLINIFKDVNYNYKRTIGLAAVVPFKIEKLLNSKLTLNGMHWAEKCSDFYDLSFSRHILFGTAELDNNFNISSKPNIKLNVSGYYTTKAIAGISDLGKTYDVSSAVKWTFAQDKAQLILKGTDLFNSNSPSVNTNFANQTSHITIIPDHRAVSLTFIYRFGGFTDSVKQPIDKTRYKGNF